MVNGIHSSAGITTAAIMLLVFTGLLNGAGIRTQGTHAHAPAEKEKVISVVQQLLDVLETRDIQKAQKNVIPGAYLAAVHDVRNGTSETRVDFRTFDEFFNFLAQSKDSRKETMSGVKVVIQQKIALVRADYKLFLNGQLHHCGVNVFTLIKKKDAWKVANLVYTYETEGCEQLNSAAAPADDRAKGDSQE